MTAAHGDARVEAYAAILAHELRTPITVISGYLELLDDHQVMDDPATLRDLLAVVRCRAVDLARAITELTAFTDGSVSMAGAPTPRTAPLTEIVTTLTQGRPLDLEVAPDAEEPPVDSARLRLALEVLLDNAYKFGYAGTAVRVRATMTTDPPRLIVRIANEGEPIPNALREAIFSPFQQADEAHSRRHGGLGLGLTVARREAELAGGSLTLETEPPTTFRLELPVREDPMAQQARLLRERAKLADAQALRAVLDFRAAQQQADDLAQRLQAAYLETVMALARAVELRDGYTGQHVERVRHHSLRLGQRLGLEAQALQNLEYGAILHDVGKLVVPDSVLTKSGALDAEDQALLRTHPLRGRELLQTISFLQPALDAVVSHHERWDGTGYPFGLKGSAIPLAGRIVAVADAYDAMTTDRPYRPRLTTVEALAALASGRGTQFDPAIVDAFQGIIAPETPPYPPRSGEGLPRSER